MTPQFVESNLRLNRDTAGTGGIRRIAGRREPDGTEVIDIDGELLPPIPRHLAPNYNRRLPPGSDIGLPDYQIAHLWGPGFGDEAWDGMMYAPEAVNQEWQNRGVETRLRDLHVLARAAGAVIELSARAVSHPLGAWRGHQLLRAARYRFAARLADGTREDLGRVEILVGAPVVYPVGPPGAPEVEVEVSLVGHI
jgi:hypothetical protein